MQSEIKPFNGTPSPQPASKGKKKRMRLFKLTLTFGSTCVTYIEKMSFFSDLFSLEKKYPGDMHDLLEFGSIF